MIKDGIIITPALNEGCINGVMRRYLLEKLTGAGHRIVETFVSVPDLENADEIFLTNAINGIRWVQQLGNKRYANKITAGIYNQLIKKITG
jgi:branched-chain amino acid aminotransferase